MKFIDIVSGNFETFGIWKPQACKLFLLLFLYRFL